jgi:hypothetical protein
MRHARWVLGALLLGFSTATVIAAPGGRLDEKPWSSSQSPSRTPHVCCVDGTCSLVLQGECEATGGVFHPEWDSCGPPNPCVVGPESRVCCVGEVCYVLTDSECAMMAGVFHPELDSCGAPDPCALHRVCCVGETCQLLLEQECAAAGGAFYPEWDSCTPDPCAQSHVCCIGETCHLMLLAECEGADGVFHAEWNSCDPGNPCVVGPDSRVCCVSEVCYLLDEEACGAMGGVFHPEWSNCGPPSPCAQHRVCCVGETCQLLLESECAAAEGVFHPEWSSCDENLCVQSGAAEPRSPSVTMLREPVPNPSMGEVLLPYEIANSGWVRIDIFDPLGRQVGSVVDSWRQVGRWQAAWNGRDRDGRRVPVGVYSVRFRIGSESQTERVLLLR